MYYGSFISGLPEPAFLAGAEAVYWVRLRLLLISTVNILFLRDPKYDYKYCMTMTMSVYDYDSDYDYG